MKLTDKLDNNSHPPFGMLMPGRSYTSGSQYRFAFNGKENDNDVIGVGKLQDYGMRSYDPRLGRFISVDPLTKKYPELSTYQFASNRPIDGIDQDGLEYATFNIFVQDGKVKAIGITKDYELKNSNTKGPGVQLNYTYLDKDGNITQFEEKPNVPNSVYGIYAGDKNPQLPLIGGDPFKLHDDYSLEPIDEVDAIAYKHDLDYSKLYPNQEGMSGVMNDATTQANLEATEKSGKIMDRFKKGDFDKITGKKISIAEFKGAWSIHDGFIAAEGVKSVIDFPGNLWKGFKNFINDVSNKTIEGINSIQNWNPQAGN